MNRVARTPLVVGLALLLSLLAGCHHHSPGTPVGVGQDADLIVRNESLNTLHVYVDDYEIGTVPPLDVAGFRVVSGTHEVSVRERGHLVIHDLGWFTFSLEAVIEVTYRD